MTDTELQQSPLGRVTSYADVYDPGLLCAIPRSTQREALGLGQPLFHGFDVWRAYEVSWLNAKGLPQVAMGRCDIPSDSAMLIESKSMKLYLNALNQSQFSSKEEVAEIISKDFSDCANAPVAWQWLSPGDVATASLSGTCLDTDGIVVDCYTVQPDYLKLLDGYHAVTEKLYTHLFKSNCLVTGQPDWASVHIGYQGCAIDHTGLLQYLMSYRLHQAFHEHCVERIWCDIWRCCKPEVLTVRAYFTRRGGIDINPVRSSHPVEDRACLRLARQ